MTRLKTVKSFLTKLIQTLTTADILLIVLLALFGAGSLFALSVLQSSGDTVDIYIDNELVYNYPLDQNRLKHIVSGYGKIMVQIQHSKVWVAHSTCPNKLCMKIGKISHAGQSIVCVPNRVLIRIRGKEGKNWIDAITQ